MFCSMKPWYSFCLSLEVLKYVGLFGMEIWKGFIANRISTPHRRCDLNLNIHEMTSSKHVANLYIKQFSSLVVSIINEKTPRNRSKGSFVNLSSLDEVKLVKFLFSSAHFAFLTSFMRSFFWPNSQYVQWKIPQWKLEQQLYLNKLHSYASNLLQQLHFFWGEYNVARTTFTASVFCLYLLKAWLIFGNQNCLDKLWMMVLEVYELQNVITAHCIHLWRTITTHTVMEVGPAKSCFSVIMYDIMRWKT